MINILVSGCSFFAGDGLRLEHNDPANAVNIFANQCFGTDAYYLNNIAKKGGSNLEIFVDTLGELGNKKYDYAFVGVTSYPRYIFQLGVESYFFNNRICFNPLDIDFPPYNGHDGVFTTSWLKDFKNRYMVSHHDHFEIINILKYQTILDNYAKAVGTKLYFVNNLAHWDDQFFNRVSDCEPNNLTLYTQKLLDTDNRDDADIKVLYNLIHDDYQHAGNIKESLWLNLYNSFRSFKIDVTSDNIHPGIKSHQNFGLYLASQFNSIHHS